MLKSEVKLVGLLGISKPPTLKSMLRRIGVIVVNTTAPNGIENYGGYPAMRECDLESKEKTYNWNIPDPAEPRLDFGPEDYNDAVLLAVKDFIKVNNEPSRAQFIMDLIDVWSVSGPANYDNKNMMKVLPSILKLQNRKEATYGRSWCEYGDFSAFFNVDRKYARIRNIMKSAVDDGIKAFFAEAIVSTGETILDTIADMGNYCIMWVGKLKEEHPQMWSNFLKSNNL